MLDRTQALIAFRAASLGAMSSVAGLVVGLGIAGAPLGGLLTPIALTLWLRVSSRSPGLRSWLAQHALLGLFAALGSGLWVPSALVSLGAPPAGAWLAASGLALWHGALPFALISLLSHPTRTRRRGLRITGYAAAVFAVETFVSRSGLFVPWVLLGHSQSSDTPLAPLATLCGVPTISAALSGLAALSICSQRSASGSKRRKDRRVQRTRRASAFAVGLLVFDLLNRTLPRVLERTNGQRTDSALRVLAVQPNLPGRERWDPPSQPIHADRIGAYSRQALDAHEPRPDLLLWPENSVTWGRDSNDSSRLLADWAARLDVALIAGLAVRDASRPARGYRSQLVWFGREGSILDSVDKELAIPGLESMPSDAWWSPPIRALLGRAASGAKLMTRADMRSLGTQGTITQALCFEALFPALVARRRTPATLLLLNPSDDHWAGTSMISRQLARYASFRAIEQHLPLVRVAHAGLTVLYDARGRELDALAPESFGALAFVVDRPESLQEARRDVAAAFLAGTLAGFLVTRCSAHALCRRAQRRFPRALPARHGHPSTATDAHKTTAMPARRSCTTCAVSGPTRS